MDKLTKEHLAPYLPYGLKLFDTFTNRVFTKTANGETLDYLTDGFGVLSTSCIKPIFRPLSDINKAKIVESYGEMVTFENYVNGDFDLGKLNWVLEEVANGNQVERLFDLPYCAFKELYKYQFDVIGAIPAGLAVDINTIKEVGNG